MLKVHDSALKRVYPTGALTKRSSIYWPLTLTAFTPTTIILFSALTSYDGCSNVTTVNTRPR